MSLIIGLALFMAAGTFGVFITCLCVVGGRADVPFDHMHLKGNDSHNGH